VDGLLIQEAAVPWSEPQGGGGGGWQQSLSNKDDFLKESSLLILRDLDKWG